MIQVVNKIAEKEQNTWLCTAIPISSYIFFFQFLATACVNIFDSIEAPKTARIDFFLLKSRIFLRAVCALEQNIENEPQFIEIVQEITYFKWNWIINLFAIPKITLSVSTDNNTTKKIPNRF